MICMTCESVVGFPFSGDKNWTGPGNAFSVAGSDLLDSTVEQDGRQRQEERGKERVVLFFAVPIELKEVTHHNGHAENQNVNEPNSLIIDPHSQDQTIALCLQSAFPQSKRVALDISQWSFMCSWFPRMMLRIETLTSKHALINQSSKHHKKFHMSKRPGTQHSCASILPRWFVFCCVWRVSSGRRTSPLFENFDSAQLRRLASLRSVSGHSASDMRSTVTRRSHNNFYDKVLCRVFSSFVHSKLLDGDVAPPSVARKQTAKSFYRPSL